MSSTGEILVSGSTYSNDFPIGRAIQSEFGAVARHGILVRISPVKPPTIKSTVAVEKPGKPLRIRVKGSDFNTGVEVYVAGDELPWPGVKLKGNSVLTSSPRDFPSECGCSFDCAIPTAARRAEAIPGNIGVEISSLAAPSDQRLACSVAEDHWYRLPQLKSYYYYDDPDGGGPLTTRLVQRIWEAHGLKPHRVKTFKFLRDPKFVEKPAKIADTASANGNFPLA